MEPRSLAVHKLCATVPVFVHFSLKCTWKKLFQCWCVLCGALGLNLYRCVLTSCVCACVQSRYEGWPWWKGQVSISLHLLPTWQWSLLLAALSTTVAHCVCVCMCVNAKVTSSQILRHYGGRWALHIQSYYLQMKLAWVSVLLGQQHSEWGCQKKWLRDTFKRETLPVSGFLNLLAYH